MADEKKATDKPKRTAFPRPVKKAEEPPPLPESPPPPPPAATKNESSTIAAQNKEWDKKVEDPKGKIEDQPPPKYEGGVDKPKAAGVYFIRDGIHTSEWWRRKYNRAPRIVIEGPTQKVLGSRWDDRLLTGHYLRNEYVDRTRRLPIGHPIRKTPDAVYVGRVAGQRVLVHTFELQETGDAS